MVKSRKASAPRAVASRVLAPAVLDAILHVLRAFGARGATIEQVAQGVPGANVDVASVRGALKALTRTGRVVRASAARYALAKGVCDPVGGSALRPGRGDREKSRHPRGGSAAGPAALSLAAAEDIRALRAADVLNACATQAATFSQALDGLARVLASDDAFSEASLKEVAAMSAPRRLLRGDRDLRKLPLVTIDGPSAKDFDDAVYAARLDGGGVRLLVAVADVASYVAQDSALDRDARARGSSIYLPGRVYPMLPPGLSDDLCSLRPGLLRRCLWVEMDLGTSGERLRYDVGAGVMRSRARLTYQRVEEHLCGEHLVGDADVAASLDALEEARRRLHAYRRTRGMLDLDLPQAQVLLGPDGEVLRVASEERLRAHRLIEEAMLAANETIASYLVSHGASPVLRIHLDPDPARWARVAPLVESLGVRVRPGHVPRVEELQAGLDRAASRPEGRVLSWMLLRSLPPARYSLQDEGHFGIGAERYLHFTSPIRRYADLHNHRLVHRLLSGARQAPASPRRDGADVALAACRSANRGEALSNLAERAAARLAGAWWFVGQHGGVWDAMVADVQRGVLFLSLRDPPIDVVLPVARLGSGPWRFEPVARVLINAQGRRVALGTPLRVQVEHVDRDRARITVRCVGFGWGDKPQSVSTAGTEGKRPVAHPRGRRRR